MLQGPTNAHLSEGVVHSHRNGQRDSLNIENGCDKYRTELAFVPDLIQHSIDHPSAPIFLPGHQGRPISANGLLFVDAGVTRNDRAHIEAIAAPRRRLNSKATRLYSQGSQDSVPGGEVAVLTNGGTGANLFALKSLLGGPGRNYMRVYFAANSHACVPSALADIHGVCARRMVPRLHKHSAQLPAAPEDVQHLLAQDKQVSAVIVTSPTIGGLVTNIKRIKSIIDNHNQLRLTSLENRPPVLLHVDQAWGPHFQNISDTDLPKSALIDGADSFSSSLHKSLDGAMGQAAVAGVRRDPELVERFRNTVNRFDTTSPSSIILGSADIALAQPKSRFISLIASVKCLKASLVKHADIILLDQERSGFKMDPTRLTFRINGITDGDKLLECLEKNQIRTILRDGEYATLHFTSPLSQQESNNILHGIWTTANELNSSLATSPRKTLDEVSTPNLNLFPELKQKIEGFELTNHSLTRIPLEESIGKICTEVISAIPPGIPIAFQGQEMNANALAAIQKWRAMPGIHMRGVSEDGTIGVIAG